uniref:Minor capsid protein P9 transmembrane helices domain-containing protein n=1 Tax=Borely moumouvirus TaxID=2712067 RepID=A0A6G6AB47_9VIRU
MSNDTYNNDIFWIYDPMVLFRNNNWYKIIPTKNMTQVEALNALTRLFIYLLIISAILSLVTNYAYISIIAIIVIIIIYFIILNTSGPDTLYDNHNHDNVEKFTEENMNNKNLDDSKNCQKSTKNNPFMNITLQDLEENNNRLEACNINDGMDEENNDRQFYTMPVTTIPNKQTEFAKWLYDLPETCKENQLNCLRFEDIRYTRYNPYLSTTNKLP